MMEDGYKITGISFKEMKYFVEVGGYDFNFTNKIVKSIDRNQFNIYIYYEDRTRMLIPINNVEFIREESCNRSLLDEENTNGNDNL